MTNPRYESVSQHVRDIFLHGYTDFPEHGYRLTAEIADGQVVGITGTELPKENTMTITTEGSRYSVTWAGKGLPTPEAQDAAQTIWQAHYPNIVRIRRELAPLGFGVDGPSYFTGQLWKPEVQA